MINDKKIEICCGSIKDVKTAIEFPIDRIELNSALELGGLTPSLFVLSEVKKITDIPICCMARCRTGGFIYTKDEYDTIFADAKLMLDNNADGIVFGFLNEDKSINKERTSQMVNLIKSYGKEAIFHKAFDETNMLESIKDLIDLKIDRVLTSGGVNHPDITKGISILKTLQQQFGNSIQILAGGGIRANNVLKILTEANITQVHMTASISVNDGSGTNNYVSVNHDKLKEILSNIK